jgi:hypothetical protein
MTRKCTTAGLKIRRCIGDKRDLVLLLRSLAPVRRDPDTVVWVMLSERIPMNCENANVRRH